jgi:hypothetical protein
MTATARRLSTAQLAPRGRSRATTKPTRVHGIRADSARGRRLDDLMHQCATLAGGWETLTAAQANEVRRAGLLSLMVEESRERMAVEGGASVDIAALVKLENVLDRQLRKIKAMVAVRPKAGRTSLADYIESRRTAPPVASNGANHATAAPMIGELTGEPEPEHDAGGHAGDGTA